MELWEQETYQYHKRLTSLREWRPDLSHLIKRLPDIPLDYTPSIQGVVGVNLSLYVLGCMAFTNQATVAFLKLWGDGLFATISLPARLIYELWGATHFAWQTLVQMQDSGDVARALARTQRLTLGARSEVQLPWGGTTSEKAVHVMDLIRSLADLNPQADDDYAFLCESCHPSYLRLTSWSLSGPILGNWANEKFRQQAHSLIDRTLGVAKRALEGIATEVTRTLELALPYVETDKSHGGS